MKKLRVVLVVLFAALMSLGLIACKKGGDDGGKAAINGFEETATLEFTDAATSADWDAALAELKVEVTREGSRRSEEVGSDEFTVEGVEGIQWGTVGTYYLTLKPVKASSASVTGSLVVTIDHAWDHATGDATCTVDGARRTVTTATEDAYLHFGPFHSTHAFSNSFGSVGALNTERYGSAIPTATVGRLMPGMTITVTGRARTTYADAEWNVADAYYYFPSYGIADASDDLAGKAAQGDSNYEGGMSVIVRSDGWVLYNGIGSSSAASATRYLGAIAGGNSEKKNYGSLENATHEDTENPPADFTENDGFMPTDLSKWDDYTVYSQGLRMYSSTYEATGEGDDMVWPNFTLSYTYRTDGVIVISMTLDNGYYITANIKVPSANQGYYDTILHGDYTDIYIHEVTTISTMTLEDITVNGLVSGANNTYAENQMFDFSTVDATAKYEQMDAPQQLTAGQISVYASASADAVIGETVGSEWVNLRTSPLTKDMVKFQVRYTYGTTTKYAALDATINIVENALDDAYGADVTVGDTLFANNGLGQLSYALADGKVVLSLGSAVATTLSAEQKTALGGAEGYNHYVAIKLYALAGGRAFNSDISAATVKLNTTDGAAVPASLTLVDGVVCIVLPVNAAIIENGVIIEGVQTTPIVIDCADVTGANVTVALSADTVSLANGGTVTATYDVSALASTDDLRLRVNGSGWRYLSDAQEERGITLNGVRVTAGEVTEGSLTITYVIPGYSPTGTVTSFTLELGEGSTTAARSVVNYDMKLAQVENSAYQDDYLVQASGTTLYITKAFSLANIQSSAVAGTLYINVNGGNRAYASLVDLSFAYDTVTGAVVFTSTDLPEGFASISATILGTVNNDKDTDLGVVVLITVDTTVRGVAADAAAYQFEINPPTTELAEAYYEVTTETSVIAAKEVPAGVELEVLEEGDCLTTGLAAGLLLDSENNVIFYLGAVSVAGTHKVENGVCVLCGSTVTTHPVNGAWYDQSVNFIVAEGEVYEVRGTYETAGTALDGTMALVIEESRGGNLANVFNSNGSGFVEFGAGGWATRLGPYAEDVEGFNDETTSTKRVTNSLITADHPYNTINGALDCYGEPIDGTSLHEAMVGGTFRYIVSYENGVITVNMRLYEEGVSLNGTPFFSYYFTLAAIEGNRYSVLVMGAADGKCTLVGGTATLFKGNTVWSNVTGVDTASAVEGYTSAGLNVATSVADGMTVLTGSGMAAKDEDGALTSYGATHYAAMTVSFGTPLVESTQAAIVDAEGNAVAGAICKLNAERDALAIMIPIDSQSSARVFTVQLSNKEGQNVADLKIDLSAVAASEVSASLANELTLAGGTLTATYTGLTETTGVTLDVNGVTKALDEVAANDVFGTLTVQSIDLTSATKTIVFTQTALDFTKAIPVYTIGLTANGALLAQSTASALKLPTAPAGVTVIEDAYVVASGSTLTFVFTTGVTVGQTKSFYLNANEGAATTAALIANYDLSFAVGATGVTFTTRNALTQKAAAVYSTDGTASIVAVTVDLTDLGIAAEDAYGFEALVGAASASTMYTVAAARTMSVLEVTGSGEKAVVVAANCSQDGTIAYAVMTGDVATFYYAVEAVKGGHTFPEDGGLCTTCENVTGWAKTVGTLGADDLTTEPSTGNGYWPGDSDRFSVIVPGQTITITGNVKAGTTGYENMNGLEVLFAPASSATPAYFRVDDWIDDVTSQTSGFGCSIAKAPSINGSTNNWTLNNQIKANADFEVTIVWTKSVTTEAGEGTEASTTPASIVITIRLMGIAVASESTFTYTLTPASGNDFTEEKYAFGITPCRGQLTNVAILATADASVVPAEDCNPIKHTHTWSAETDRCTSCGTLNPAHEHSYDSTTHACKCGNLDPNHTHSYTNGTCTVCGVPCYHATIANGVCSVCGMSVTAVTDASYPTTGFQTRQYSVPVTLKKGEVISIYGTQVSAMETNWNSLCVEFSEGYTLRTDNYGWSFAPTSFGAYTNAGLTVKDKGGNVVVADVAAMNAMNWSLLPEIGKACNYCVTVDWTGASLKVTITFTATAGTYAGYTYTCTYDLPITNTALAEINIHLGAEGNATNPTTITVTGYAVTPAATTGTQE